jgi:hypothetical protein
MPPPHTATRGRASTWAMASHSGTPRRPARWGSAQDLTIRYSKITFLLGFVFGS